MASTLPETIVRVTDSTVNLNLALAPQQTRFDPEGFGTIIKSGTESIRNSDGSIEKGLTERFVNLYQIPEELTLNFQGDIVGVTKNPNHFGLPFTAEKDQQVQPVRPIARTYMPMIITLLQPKIPINLDGLRARNQQLTSDIGDEVTLLSGELTEKAEDFQLVIETIKNAPPLIFYINPNDLSRTFQRRYTEQFGGNGHIIEHWGEEQDKLTASGKIGATYTTKTGLARYFRRNSASYQQLMQLYLLYRNNGYIYEVADLRRISLVGRVQITYDTETWIGHFDSFSMNENAESPFTMEYSFEFTAREYFNDESLNTTSEFIRRRVSRRSLRGVTF